jgi:hypothetical protein
VLVSSSETWCEAAVHLSERRGIRVSPINVRALLGPDEGALVAQDLGIGDHGASLVRPDGFIAWRSRDGDAEALERKMTSVAQLA